MQWYWSAMALLLAVILISAIGLLARYYIGKKLIEWTERLLMHVPLLNKIYGAIKQVNEAFTGNKDSFKTVVLVEFPLAGTHSIGFITNDQPDDVQKKANQNSVCVFVPTTPNPTAGFLLIVPEEKVVKLDMSVGEGLKYLISLGSISPLNEKTKSENGK